MIVVDTTILALAVGTEHELRDAARRLVSAVTSRSLEAATTPEVIQEFAHVRARRYGRADAAQLGRRYSELLSPLLVVESDHLERGLRLFEELGFERWGFLPRIAQLDGVERDLVIVGLHLRSAQGQK